MFRWRTDQSPALQAVLFFLVILRPALFAGRRTYGLVGSDSGAGVTFDFSRTPNKTLPPRLSRFSKGGHHGRRQGAGPTCRIIPDSGLPHPSRGSFLKKPREGGPSPRTTIHRNARQTSPLSRPRLPGRVAWALFLGFLSAPSQMWVPRPCAFCKGGNHGRR